MVKISFIGAGSSTFSRKLITDLLAFPNLRKNLTIDLYDIDNEALNATYELFPYYLPIPPPK